MLKVDNKEINYNFWLILNPIPHLEWTLELREDVVVVFHHIFTFLTPCRTHSLSPGKRVAHTQYQCASQSHGRCDEISVPLSQCREQSAWEQHKPSAEWCFSHCFSHLAFLWLLSVGQQLWSQDDLWSRGIWRKRLCSYLCLCSSKGLEAQKEESVPEKQQQGIALEKPSLKSGSLVNICFCTLRPVMFKMWKCFSYPGAKGVCALI